jgi:hypothetical protein
MVNWTLYIKAALTFYGHLGDAGNLDRRRNPPTTSIASFRLWLVIE